MTRWLVLILCAALLAGCRPSPEEAPRSAAAAELSVFLADPDWDGARVPEKGICKQGGGAGMSPALSVRGVPAGADAVVVEFNDRDYEPLSTDGGHGAIWVSTNGAPEALVPSVPEQTLALPAGVNMEHPHRGRGFGEGAYLAPCSLGLGHRYFADVRAEARPPDGPRTVLARGTIELGVY